MLPNGKMIIKFIKHEFKSNDSKIGYNLTNGGDGFAYGALNPVHRPD